MGKTKYHSCPKILLSNYEISCPESAACPDPNCQSNERSCFCCQEARSRGKIGCSGEQTKENEQTCPKIIGSKDLDSCVNRETISKDMFLLQHLTASAPSESSFEPSIINILSLHKRKWSFWRPRKKPSIHGCGGGKGGRDSFRRNIIHLSI